MAFRLCKQLYVTRKNRLYSLTKGRRSVDNRNLFWKEQGKSFRYFILLDYNLLLQYSLHTT
jgi:hypothetical protein